MKKGAGTPENTELAFRVYALSGGRNIHRMLYRLEHVHGLALSSSVLYTWKEQENWEGHMSPPDGLSSQGVLTFEERLLLRIMSLIEKCERYFVTNNVVKDINLCLHQPPAHGHRAFAEDEILGDEGPH